MSCPECFSGSVHEGKPRGKITKLHGLDTYVSEPADGRTPKAIIVVIPDAFGWEFVNNRLLCDHYADKGDYTVYMPDFMADSMRALSYGSIIYKPYHLVKVLYGFIPFIYQNYIGASHPRVRSFFEALRAHEGATQKVGAAGFCWGGKHALLLCHDKQENDNQRQQLLVDAAFTGHPSFLELPADVDDSLRVPVSFAIGELDNVVGKANMEKLCVAVESDNRPPETRGEVRIYPGAGHGFCVRADSTLNDVAKQAVEAEDQCIAWFNNHFGLGQ